MAKKFFNDMPDVDRSALDYTMFFEEIDYTISNQKEGYYANDTFAFIPLVDRISVKLRCKEGQKIRASATLGGAAGSMFIFADKDENYLSKYYGGDNQQHLDIIATVPENAYWVAITGKESTGDFKVERYYRDLWITEYNSAERHNLVDYVNGEIAVANRYSIPVCDLYRNSGINDLNKSSYVEADLLHPNAAAYTFIGHQTADFIAKFGGFSSLSGKTVGVFGGSFALNAANTIAAWTTELGVTVTNYAISGAGFSSLTGSKIDAQVDGAALKDIYIIWCSSNDCVANVDIGNIDNQDDETQSYGLNQTITKLFAKNPNAKVLLFTSLKAYSQQYLYDSEFDRY